MYLYTDAIEFAPFGSDENRRSRRPEAITPSDDKVHIPTRRQGLSPAPTMQFEHPASDVPLP